MTQSIELKVNIPEKKAYSYDILTGQNLLMNADEIVKKYGGTFQAESGEDWYRAKVLVQLGEDEQKNE